MAGAKAFDSFCENPFLRIGFVIETGAFIWRRLAEGLSTEEIAEQLRREYANVDAETAQKAVQSIVDKLAKDGLLEE